ncbi:protein of unknown function [Hyphomicrobium sp. MC1]|nr:protein of unknown function [Hyphomicrobium sp. MC1]
MLLFRHSPRSNAYAGGIAISLARARQELSADGTQLPEAVCSRRNAEGLFSFIHKARIDILSALPASPFFLVIKPLTQPHSQPRSGCTMFRGVRLRPGGTDLNNWNYRKETIHVRQKTFSVDCRRVARPGPRPRRGISATRLARGCDRARPDENSASRSASETHRIARNRNGRYRGARSSCGIA